jgi:hypothetical protein
MQANRAQQGWNDIEGKQRQKNTENRKRRFGGEPLGGPRVMKVTVKVVILVAVMMNLKMKINRLRVVVRQVMMKTPSLMMILIVMLRAQVKVIMKTITQKI